MVESSAARDRRSDSRHPCLSSVMTEISSNGLPCGMTLQEKPSWSCLKSFAISSVTSLCRRILCISFLFKLSTAQSHQNTNTVVSASILLAPQRLSVAIWSMHDLSSEACLLIISSAVDGIFQPLQNHPGKDFANS